MRFTIFLALAIVLSSCTSDDTGNWKSLDLMKYNLPVTIMAPDSAKVKSSSLSGVMQDVTIDSPEDRYAVQIFSSQANTNDLARLKAEQLQLVRDNRYFSNIVREEPNGFIFMNQIDSTSLYGFRHIVYQGDQEIVFQNSFGGTFTLEETEAMYAAVKQK